MPRSPARRHHDRLCRSWVSQHLRAPYDTDQFYTTTAPSNPCYKYLAGVWLHTDSTGHTRISVPNDVNLRRRLLEEFHGSPAATDI